jgi:hypothetical protein
VILPDLPQIVAMWLNDAERELSDAADHHADGERDLADACLRGAAHCAGRAMALVPGYRPEWFWAIGRYYETRDRIVELVQARRVAA